MKVIETEGAEWLSSGAFKCLKETLTSYGSALNEPIEAALYSTVHAMGQLLHGQYLQPTYLLASLDPGSGKTEALCAFLRTWKASGFTPASGALIVLSTRKEIESCIARSGLQRSDFAVLVQKDHPLNGRGSLESETAPVLFTTQEKLRRECEGRRFGDVGSLYYRGQPRALRVWDEAFLPATPVTLRKDTMLQPLADLRPVAPAAAASLESISDSLSADRVGEAVQVPLSALGVHRDLGVNLGHSVAERLSGLKTFAGREAVIVNCNGRGLHLAGASQRLPADFAPALILDASGRVRETYGTLEAAGILERLPSAPRDYSGLRVNHWDRAASRSALSEPKARREVLEAAAEAINASGTDEPWLVVHAQDRAGTGHSIVQDLKDLVSNPERLAFVHWGNHHGTNDYRDVAKVLVLGLWHHPQPAYTALHLAAGGSVGTATDKAALDALKAGEHRHHLLQAICRASVRNGTDGGCEVYLAGRLGSDGREMLLATLPGAQVDDWRPEGQALTGSALRVSQELERLLAVPGVRRVQKGALGTSLGFRTGEALAKVIRRGDFRRWMARAGLEVTTRAFERAAA